MTKSFETLIEDVQELLLNGYTVNIDKVKEFSDRLSSVVSEKLSKNEERTPKLYLSNIGKPLRQLWYDMKGYKGEPISGEAKLKFAYGDLTEELFLFLAEQAGHEVRDRQKRLEYEGISGKIDARIDGVLVDVKSCSPASFEKFKRKTLPQNDPFGYIAQLSGYKQALKSERAAFVAIDKTLGKICTFELTKEVENEYNLNQRVRDVREAIGRDSPPERCYSDKPHSSTDKSGNRVLSIGCEYCAHKFRCWGDSNEGRGLQVRYYSTGPRFFTSLVKEPKLRTFPTSTTFTDDFEVKE